MPTLVLEDGTAIGKVPAICRYIEEIHPASPLLGETAKENAQVAMWERRAELAERSRLRVLRNTRHDKQISTRAAVRE